MPPHAVLLSHVLFLIFPHTDGLRDLSDLNANLKLAPSEVCQTLDQGTPLPSPMIHALSRNHLF